MRYVYILLAALFALFTYFQANDPDAVPWLLVYGAVAVVFGLAAAGRLYRPLIIGLGVVCLAVTLYHLPAVFDFATNQDGMGLEQGMSYDYPYIERSREAGGMLIATLALLWLYLQARRTPAA
ncbi:MAG: hypothetical protein OHK0039_49320 [Bacteroidia bacterium]